jgi:hypothetical protein
MIFTILFLIVLGKFLDRFASLNGKNPTKWKDPPTWVIQLFITILWPFQFRAVNDCPKPPSRKVMFVTNHNLFGLELPFTLAAIYMQTGLFPRAITDRFRIDIINLDFLVPVWKHLFCYFGGFMGNREECNRVMEAGYPILVIPGGSAELIRAKKIPKYTLQWKERKGFAELAIKHGYTLIPVSIVGIDDMFWHIFDFPLSWIMKLFGYKKVDKDLSVPIVLPIPCIPKIRIRFGKAWKNTSIGIGKSEDLMACEVRDFMKLEIQEGISQIQSALK